MSVKAKGRLKRFSEKHWHAPDYPGAEPRFQIMLFSKHFSIFVLLPLLAIFLFRACEKAFSSPRPAAKPVHSDDINKNFDAQKSQIIDFQLSPAANGKFFGISKRAPGTLVHAKLLNVVETYSSTPVYAQITDTSLGSNLVGATLIGEATSDTNVQRINVTFQNVRDPSHEGLAIPIVARALSLDGTFGVVAEKKEGFFARAAMDSSGEITKDSLGVGNDIQHFLMKALASGLLQEAGSEAKVQQNRAHVLSLKPNTEFLVELTDYFPGGRR